MAYKLHLIRSTVCRIVIKSMIIQIPITNKFFYFTFMSLSSSFARSSIVASTNFGCPKRTALSKFTTDKFSRLFLYLLTFRKQKFFETFILFEYSRKGYQRASWWHSLFAANSNSSEVKFSLEFEISSIGIFFIKLTYNAADWTATVTCVIVKQ